MKTVIIVRHAKSSWEAADIKDIDRPLNERGKKDAAEMAQRLLKKTLSIDAFISSPAKRAKRTAEIFANQFNSGNIIYIDGLYHSPSSFISGIISKSDEKYNTIAIFSHNPGITEFVNTLTDSIRTDNVPTCGIFAVRAAIDKWNAFETAKKDFWFYDYPKLAQ
jgi:phosphohistidine phosphatase